jgi:hypothetical protein
MQNFDHGEQAEKPSGSTIKPGTWSAPAPVSRPGFSPLDAVDVTGSRPILVRSIGSARDQTAAGAEFGCGVDRGQAMASRQRDDQIAMNQCQRTFGPRAKAAMAR